MLETLVAAETAALFIGLPLLWLFARERIKNLARETTDKALADYKHTQDQILAQINAGHQRRVQEFGLFAQRRNEVYAETYSLFEKARGGYASHFAHLIETRDFSRSPEADLRNLAKTLTRISESERETLVHALDGERLADARRIANELFERDSLRDANRAFYEFKSAWVLHALYFSPIVSEILAEGAQTLGLLSIFADEVIEEGRRSQAGGSDRRSRAEQIGKSDQLSVRLRTAMQAEMRPSTDDPSIVRTE
jgi:hypothetical protein